MEVFTEIPTQASSQKSDDDFSQGMLDDLQLAAELGKTLLERNKELEALIKEHKHTIEEQEQEILYLKKHTTALREVNDSRLKVYEQLEVGIQELERAKHHLLVENTSDKRHIKTLTSNIETLEARCEELTKQLEEERQNLCVERRKNERLLAEKSKINSEQKSTNVVKHFEIQRDKCDGNLTDHDFWQTNSNNGSNNTTSTSDYCKEKNINSSGISVDNSIPNSMELNMVCNVADGSEEIIKLVQDLEATKRAYLAEQQRCSELEEQLVATIQENQTLQSRIAQSNANEDMKSMHDELSILDEVRQGQMCSRCLRSINLTGLTGNDERSSIAPTEECEEDEEHSLLELDVNRDDNVSEHSQAAFYNNTPNKATRPGITTTSTPINNINIIPHNTSISTTATNICPICLNDDTKYLRKQFLLTIEKLLLRFWQKCIKRFNLIHGLMKILQWPTIFLTRLINSIPDDEEFLTLLF